MFIKYLWVARIEMKKESPFLTLYGPKFPSCFYVTIGVSFAIGAGAILHTLMEVRMTEAIGG